MNWRHVMGWLPLAAVLCSAGSLVAAPDSTPEPAPNRGRIPLGLDAYMPIPEANPLTLEKVTLGRRLFSDPILSRAGGLACDTCHDRTHGFADGRPISVGVFGRSGERNVPTLVNRGYGSAFLWDGRARTLEEQVLQPIQNPNELDLSLDEAIARIRQDTNYRKLFRQIFDREATATDLACVLASYVRTILSSNSPVDDYEFAGKRGALSLEARLGLQVFRGKVNCTACHNGSNYTDEAFHNTGIAWPGASLLDVGRFAVTGRDSNRGAFKTPTLREVARTAPYMHDGTLSTLEEVVDYYDRGGNANPFLDPELRPLHLTTEEKQALVVFLKSLSGTIREGVQGRRPF